VSVLFDKRIVVPLLLISSIASKIVWTTSGPARAKARPATAGADATSKARAIASICCSPPESVPAFCVSRSFKRGNILKQRSMSEAICVRFFCR